MDFPILDFIIATPAVGGLVIALLPRQHHNLAQPLAVVFAAWTAALAAWMLGDFDKADAGFQYISRAEWIEQLGIQWLVGVDGISLFLVVMTAFIFPIAILAVKPESDAKSYFAWLLVLESASLGVFLALDLFLFFVFFEFVLVPMYFLIAKWGHGDARYAATKFFLFTMLGSAFMFVGIISLAVLHAQATGDPITFDLIAIAENPSIATNTARWLFLSFAIAFAVKVPVFPVHTWLPDAHTNAPTAGSVILAAVLLKLGTYGFIRFGIYLFPEAADYFAPLLLTLGVIGILYGAVVATMQKDLKRIVAYSSVAHLGFIVLGVFAINSEGLEGGVLQMVNHGISTGALFILVGWIYDRRHTRMVADLGGLQKPAPIMAAAFMIVMLSSIGLPGLNGFVGEFLILIGSFVAHRWWAVAATAGVILAALYLLWAYQRVFHGPAEGDNATMSDMNWREGLVVLPLIAAVILLGVYPKPVLDRMGPSVDALIVHVERHVGDFEEPVPQREPAGGFEELDLEELEELHGEDEEHGEELEEAASRTEPNGAGEARQEATEAVPEPSSGGQKASSVEAAR